MVTGKNIVVIAIHPWDINGGSNIKDIALEFSKQNKVLFIERPLDRKNRLIKKRDSNVKRIIRIRNGEDADLVKVNTQLWIFQPNIIIESINWTHPGAIYTRLNKRNNRLFSNSISKAMNRLGFKDILIFNDSEMILGFYLKEFLKPKLYIYYIRDNLIYNPYWRRHGKYLEPKLIEKSDLVVANSEVYTHYAIKYNPNSFMVGQGCDLSLFKDAKVDLPEQMREIKRPIVGYSGYLTSRRLDISLIEYLGKTLVDFNIVLIGNEDDEFKASALHHLKNVFFLGSVDSSQVASFMGNFDVCINPQLVSPVTVGNYPRKIDEYLAMGKPVVATSTEAMLYFDDVVYLAKSKNEFCELIKIAYNSDNEQKKRQRVAVAKRHSWKNSIEKIYTAIEKIENNG